MWSVTSAAEAVKLEYLADVPVARRRAVAVASTIGLDETQLGRVALITTEMATNVIKHAGHGGLLIAKLVQEIQGISLIAWDCGPGMYVPNSIVDGVSTSATLGTGLGAISRLASQWDVYSGPKLGTVISAVVCATKLTNTDRFVLGGVSVPIPGELECGDSWDAVCNQDVASLIVADGLGHGPGAAEAARSVIEAFRERPFDPPAVILERAHHFARATRGAAASVVRVESARNAVIFAGIGNVGGVVLNDGKGSHMLSQHGTLGHAVRRIHEGFYPLPSQARVILTSDGLKSHWDLTPYVELGIQSPATIAALLWRDFARGRDDATAVVLAAGAMPP
jgi:anti-sigma regulatory factor (Ser/Thr protein kinase)